MPLNAAPRADAADGGDERCDILIVDDLPDKLLVLPAATRGDKQTEAGEILSTHLHPAGSASDDLSANRVRRIDVFPIAWEFGVEVARIMHRPARQPLPPVGRNAKMAK